MKLQLARLFYFAVFVMMALPAIGMESPSSGRVHRPFRQVALAIYGVIPDSEHSLKASLNDLVTVYDNARSAYCAPELFWLEMQELLVTNIQNTNNHSAWAQVVKGIFEDRIDYKNYQPSTGAMVDFDDSGCQTRS